MSNNGAFYKDLQSFFQTKERQTMVKESKRILAEWKDDLKQEPEDNYKIPERLYEQASLMLNNAKQQLLSEGYNTSVGTTVSGEGTTGVFGQLHTLVIPLVKRLVGKSIMIRDFVETQTMLSPQGIAYAVRILKGEYGDGNWNRLNELNVPKNNRQSLGGFKLQFVSTFDDTLSPGTVALATIDEAIITDDIQKDFTIEGAGTATAKIYLPAIYYKRVDSFVTPVEGTNVTFTFDVTTPWDSVSIANYIGANETDILSTRLVEKLSAVTSEEMGQWLVGDLAKSGISMDISYANIQEGWKKNTYGEGIYTDDTNELKARGYDSAKGRTGRHSKIKLGIDTKSIEAESRSVWCDYTDDMADDLKTVQNISLKDIFIEQIEAQLIDEVDRDLFESMRSLAVDTTKGGADLMVSQVTTTADNSGRWMGEKLATMLSIVTLMSEDIYRSSRLGRGNFGIITTTMASAVISAPAMYSGVEVEDERSDETAYVGKIGRVSYYEDLWGEFNTGSGYEDYSEVFVGYKGKQQGHTGIIFCPYRTASLSEAINPDTHNPSIKIKMRYGIMENLLDSGAYYRGGVISGIRAGMGIQ